MDSFEVENFRSLKHLKLEKLARVNLLVGKNNSGKTSVLEALIAVLGVGGVDWLSIIERERGLHGERADFKYLFYLFDIKRLIKLSVAHRGFTNNSNPHLMLENIILRLENRAVTREQGASNFSLRNSTTVLMSAIESPAVSVPIIFETGRVEREQFYAIPVSEGAEKAVAGDFDFPFTARHAFSEILTTTIDQETLSHKIEAIKVNKREGPLLLLIQTVDSRIRQIQLGGNNQIYLDCEGFQTLVPLNLMGEGVQRLLDVISAFANVGGGVVLIDEIDNGLHYSALRILWKGILKAAREYDVQVFATTHSAEALRHLTWVLDDEEYKDYRDDVAAYTLIRAKDDTVRSFRYDYEQLEFAMDNDIEVRN
ncbi:AAA family ATPase [Hymenobacter arcticus]